MLHQVGAGVGEVLGAVLGMVSGVVIRRSQIKTDSSALWASLWALSGMGALLFHLIRLRL